jgi:hypothetical protein
MDRERVLSLAQTLDSNTTKGSSNQYVALTTALYEFSDEASGLELNLFIKSCRDSLKD